MVYKVAVLLLLTTLLIESKTTAVGSTDASDSNQCTIGTIYKSSLPTGGNGVEHLTVLGVGLKADECINQCCSLGPGGCQYLWVMEKMCVAVACESTKLSSCKPKMVATSKLQSLYVLMEHPQQSPNGLEDAIDWVNKIIHGNKEEEKEEEKESGDSPPIAATPTDEIRITLPTNEVYLYGNNSKDDKGISAYSWKLLTEHFVQPTLENADKAILHVRNLIPGTYQFSLTVTDTSGQSGRTTVLVRVSKGSTETILTTTTDSTPTPTADSASQTSTTLLGITADIGSGGNDTASIEDQTVVEENYYTKRRNVLKIVIPVLLSLAVLLVVTAAITTACACCCERNKHRMKRYYKYRRLPETIEKT